MYKVSLIFQSLDEILQHHTDRLQILSLLGIYDVHVVSGGMSVVYYYANYVSLQWFQMDGGSIDKKPEMQQGCK